MDLNLKNKTALITGSTAGIGYAIAKSLATEGVSVYINGRSQVKVDEAARKLIAETGNENIKGIAADFANPAQISALIEQLPEVDILVNNVGIFEPKDFLAITDEDWLKFYEVNVLSGVRMARAYFNKMLSKNWGRIIFISSESAYQIPAEMIHYGMTKTAQIAVARGLAELTTNTGVTVNTILPGPTLSEGVGDFVKALADGQGVTTTEIEKDFFANIRGTSLLKRFITTDEIANLVTYVASPLSAATNGATLRADGGVIKTAF
ncbi:NAD(P)-dependent dehydrogenase (short-subunit alcohol dehydrogenase family) [Mucilaginibacter oryzae]|uniref:NAD(P)-dependent dehydrogenase (Short-subunit alcohol dehydrogenase family) n=1 Tax=Mucilaginibacter oryzae TaxID=468058 RepID=A0A316HDL1_9SPHI|nr:SDR family oxidoreductase [Mucilaginibacter oryzae]PWK79309.1 NAD(P)-dependent dehydrogenase (short-subunit alcohol dehydrogenase family) [Mucilaginibacter oryzae]